MAMVKKELPVCQKRLCWFIARDSVCSCYAGKYLTYHFTSNALFVAKMICRMPVWLVSSVNALSSWCVSFILLYLKYATIIRFRCRYKTWVTNPKLAQQMAEKVTRKTIGVACCPVAGIPPPRNDEEEELLELTNELNLSWVVYKSICFMVVVRICIEFCTLTGNWPSSCWFRLYSLLLYESQSLDSQVRNITWIWAGAGREN